MQTLNWTSCDWWRFSNPQVYKCRKKNKDWDGTFCRVATTVASVVTGGKYRMLGNIFLCIYELWLYHKTLTQDQDRVEKKQVSRWGGITLLSALLLWNPPLCSWLISVHRQEKKNEWNWVKITITRRIPDEFWESHKHTGILHSIRTRCWLIKASKSISLVVCSQ